MTQLKELLEKEELEHLKEVKNELKEETSGTVKSQNGSKALVWLVAIIVAVVIFK